MKKSVLVCSIQLFLLVACGGASGASPGPTPEAQPTQVETPALPAAETLAPAPTRPPATSTPAITVTKDVIYATSLVESEASFPFVESESSWALDVYAPVENGDWPTVVLIHGLDGNKEGYAPAGEIISDNGAVVYAVNWPYKAPDLAARDNGRAYREISETLTCAIRFARATAADFGGDSSRVTLVAHSYGALYGVWIALASDGLDARWEAFRADREGPPPQVACERGSDSARVDAFIGIGGQRYTSAEILKDRDRELWEIVSPFAYLGQNTELPVILLHGEQDNRASPEFSQTFNEVLFEAGYDSRMILFDGTHIVPPQLTFDAVIELAGE